MYRVAHKQHVLGARISWESVVRNQSDTGRDLGNFLGKKKGQGQLTVGSALKHRVRLCNTWRFCRRVVAKLGQLRSHKLLQEILHAFVVVDCSEILFAAAFLKFLLHVFFAVQPIDGN